MNKNAVNGIKPMSFGRKVLNTDAIVANQNPICNIYKIRM